MLNFDPTWRFRSPAPVSQQVVWKFSEYIDVISEQLDKKWVYELFKSKFAGPAGRQYWGSSSTSFAQSDLSDYMSQAAESGPRFIEAFYDCCEQIKQINPDVAVPDYLMMNAVLAEFDAGFEVRPPNLVATRTYTPVAVPAAPLSLDREMQLLIEQSLQASDRFLHEGQNVPAVQALLWLVESFATAFNQGRSEDTVQSRYLNQIVKELQQKKKGTAPHKILSWMMQLHDHLSNPDGGGVRHGLNVNTGRPMQPHEARLYCNLIRSYYTFLVAEHEAHKSA